MCRAASPGDQSDQALIDPRFVVLRASLRGDG